jgi:hypothetical protein
MKPLPLNLPQESELMGDSAYTDYLLEDMMQDSGIRLLAVRKASSKCPHNPGVEYLISSQRKRVESVFFPMWPNGCLNLFIPLLMRGF